MGYVQRVLYYFLKQIVPHCLKQIQYQERDTDKDMDEIMSEIIDKTINKKAKILRSIEQMKITHAKRRMKKNLF